MLSSQLVPYECDRLTKCPFPVGVHRTDVVHDHSAFGYLLQSLRRLASAYWPESPPLLLHSSKTPHVCLCCDSGEHVWYHITPNPLHRCMDSGAALWSGFMTCAKPDLEVVFSAFSALGVCTKVTCLKATRNSMRLSRPAQVTGHVHKCEVFERAQNGQEVGLACTG